MRTIRFLIAGLLLLAAPVCFSQRTVIHCGKLIDGKNKEQLSQVTLVVEGGKIISIDKGFTPAAAGDTFINLSRKTVMPGLIDMHVHLEEELGKGYYAAAYTANDADIAFASIQYAKRTLLAGFTTVRDLGGTGINNSLRNAVNQGIIVGPRIISAGKYISSTGGHGDPTNGAKKGLLPDPGPKEGVINGPDEAREAVRQRYKEGSDMIKITSTAGVGSVAKDGTGPQFSDEELRAIVETAKDYGFQVAAHAHGTEGMLRAVKAGVNTIEHGTFMTDEIMDLMKEKKTYFVPTIIAGKTVAEMAKTPGLLPELVVPKAIFIGSKMQENFGKAYKRGVPIAFGTDAGVCKHGDNAKEFTYMVEAGMPAIEALLSAMQVNANALGLGDKIGSLEKGKNADIVAVDSDPTVKINVMEKVTFVMRDGVVYKNL
ncbi:MAG: amidohydrolase family protein [Bacteroidota bacterium]